MNVFDTRYEAALRLLKYNALKQMCEGKSTCTLTEDDVKEVLFVAGMDLRDEVEVIRV